jgi:tetratricopeptide (TPR) repeat protein
VVDALDHMNAPSSNANLISIYQNFGLCYLAIEEHDSALEYFALVSSLTEISSILSKIYSYIGDVHLRKNEFANAVEYYNLALEFDSSNEDFVIMIYSSIGAAYHLSGDIQNALYNYQRALNIQLATESNDMSTLATTYGNIANAHWQAGNLTEAVDHYTKQLELETDANLKREIEENIQNLCQQLNLQTIHDSIDQPHNSEKS